ncbi:hypothetical protein LINGRAHAP2_LOCUS14748 [Linum grandiflorum]
MFFLPPGHSLVDGLHPLHSEADVRQLVEDAKFGVVTLYLEATFCEAVVGDNEDDTSEGNPGYGSSGDEGDSDELNSGVGADVGVVHLIDDSDRTSDPEFMQAMANLGISHMRRRMRTTFASDGEEVDLVNELYVNQGHANDGGIAEGGNEVGTEGNGDNGDDEEVLPDDMNVDQHDGVHGDDERDFSSSDSDDPDYNDRMKTGSNSPVSSYRGSSQSDHMVDDKVDGEEVSSMELQPFYDPHCDHLNMEWKVGMRFVSPQQFKEAVVMYNIKYGSQIRWKRSNRKCKEGVGKEHNCPRFTHNRGATASWIAKRFVGSFRMNPHMDVELLQKDVKKTYGLDVTLKVCSYAKAQVKQILEGTLTSSYAKLRPYLLQLKKADPEGTFVVEVDPVVPGKNYVLFRPIYIGFSCLRKGFIAGCRRFFALDGCFLKGEVPGMILSVVGKDRNNQMFPIAWAVVESENRSSWGWFITILQETMGLDDGTGWTVISDQQKPVNVDPTTTRRALQREVRTACNGIGVYVNPSTGNSYYRGGPSWRAGVRRSKAVDRVGTPRADEVVQPTPPPASQPSE